MHVRRTLLLLEKGDDIIVHSLIRGTENCRDRVLTHLQADVAIGGREYTLIEHSARNRLWHVSLCYRLAAAFVAS